MELNFSEKPDAIIGTYDGIEYNLIKTKSELYEGKIFNINEDINSKGTFEVKGQEFFLLDGSISSKKMTEYRTLKSTSELDIYKGQVFRAAWKSKRTLDRIYSCEVGTFKSNGELELVSGRTVEGVATYKANNTYDLRTDTKEKGSTKFMSIKVVNAWVKNVIAKNNKKTANKKLNNKKLELDQISEAERINTAKMLDKKFEKSAKTLASKLF